MAQGFRAFWQLLKSAGTDWVNDRAQRMGAALAFYTVLAVSPLFIIVFYVVNLWLSATSARDQIFAQISDLAGPQGARALQNILANPQLHTQGAVASAIAIGTLLLTATGLFIELQDDLNLIWGVQAKPGQGVRGFIKNRLLSFAMLIGTGFLLLVSLIVSAALAALNKYFSGLVSGWGVFWQALNVLVSLGVITLLFAMIYKFLPDVKVSWREVWLGALTTALLFTIGKLLLGMYLGRSSVASTYGAAGSLVIILLWVYYSAQILFFGAELTQAFACRFGRRPLPADNAQWIRGGKCGPNKNQSNGAANAEKEDNENTRRTPRVEKHRQLVRRISDQVQSWHSRRGP